MQWLGIDLVPRRSKDANLYPEYMDLQEAIYAEGIAFVDHILNEGGGSLSELLGADYALITDDGMAQLYGVSRSDNGPVDLSATPRRGILSQAAFLSVHSNPNNSGPIHRGVAVIERILCVELITPGELNIEVVPPEPDPNATTRDLFAQHTIDPACAGCHMGIDGVGFAFEQFDPIGRVRTQENGRDINTSGELIFTEVQGEYPSSKEMIEAIAVSDVAKQCFAQNAFGFASAQADEEVTHSFDQLWEANTLPANAPMDEALVLFISSDLFIHRRIAP
ncbi:MAG: DUF1588 domain-containing protein, partial [Myxococcota bacterium]